MSLRAYKVSHDEELSEIEFFSDEDAEQGIGQEDYAEVERAPSFDKYAPGPVTMAQYLAEGWWWACGSASTTSAPRGVTTVGMRESTTMRRGLSR